MSFGAKKLRHLNGLLVFMEIFIGFSVICVLPFVWILRDGLGPSAVSTTGLAAASKMFMSFYIGPVILFLVSLDLAVRRFIPAVESPSSTQTWIHWIIAFATVVLLSYAMVWLMMV